MGHHPVAHHVPVDADGLRVVLALGEGVDGRGECDGAGGYRNDGAHTPGPEREPGGPGAPGEAGDADDCRPPALVLDLDEILRGWDVVVGVGVAVVRVVVAVSEEPLQEFGDLPHRNHQVPGGDEAGVLGHPVLPVTGAAHAHAGRAAPEGGAEPAPVGAADDEGVPDVVALHGAADESHLRDGVLVQQEHGLGRVEPIVGREDGLLLQVVGVGRQGGQGHRYHRTGPTDLCQNAHEGLDIVLELIQHNPLQYR